MLSDDDVLDLLEKMQEPIERFTGRHVLRLVEDLDLGIDFEVHNLVLAPLCDFSACEERGYCHLLAQADIVDAQGDEKITLGGVVLWFTTDFPQGDDPKAII